MAGYVLVDPPFGGYPPQLTLTFEQSADGQPRIVLTLPARPARPLWSIRLRRPRRRPRQLHSVSASCGPLASVPVTAGSGRKPRWSRWRLWRSAAPAPCCSARRRQPGPSEDVQSLAPSPVAASSDFAGFVAIGGRRNWLACRGQSGPAVVLAAGVNSRSDIWSRDDHEPTGQRTTVPPDPSAHHTGQRAPMVVPVTATCPACLPEVLQHALSVTNEALCE